MLVPATIVVALDHLLRGIFWPQSVYGVLVASQWRWLEHAAWVIFEDIFLVVSCLRSGAEMRQRADRTAALEQEVRTRQEAEIDARNTAALAGAVGLALTHDAELDVMLQKCADALVQPLDGGFAAIWTLDEAGQTLELMATAGVDTEVDAAYSRVPVGRFAIGAIARDRKPCLTVGFSVDAQMGGADWALREGFAVFAGYPLLLDSKLIGVMAVFARRDFTASAIGAMAAVADGMALGIDRKRSEGELARYTRDLEHAHETQRENTEQLSTLVEELRTTQKQAEAATRAKSDFLASMSHELRTPLNAIILYSELLQEEAEDHHEPGSIPDLQRIQSAGKHLLDLINGILDLSKIEAGKMALSLEDIEIRSMIDELIDTVGPLVQKNDNTMTVRVADDVSRMHADLMKTRQILLNLLSNAGKFTRDGAITLDVSRRTVDASAGIEFRVTDTGLGMTAEQTGKIFEPFTQADVTTTRKYGGTGLGLAIVSRFCQLMGGSVSVESRPGDGSCFTVCLPLTVVDAVAEPDVMTTGAA